MKKFMLMLVLCISGFVWGQTTDYAEEFCLQPGQTASWQPFTECKELRFSTTGSDVAKVMPKPDGHAIITALDYGTAYITARCGEESEKVKVIVAKIKPENTFVMNYERPATKPFTGHYAFNPPTDHFFISYSDPLGESTETRAKIGDEESYHDGKGIDRFWNVKTGEIFYFHLDNGWKPDVKFDFEPLNPDFFPLNAFAVEVPYDSIADCFIGMENCLGINCWVFFTRKPNGSIVKFWVDPANGCTLKRQNNYDEPCSVKVYNLDYHHWEFGPRHKKSYKDVTR